MHHLLHRLAHDAPLISLTQISSATPNGWATKTDLPHTISELLNDFEMNLYYKRILKAIKKAPYDIRAAGLSVMDEESISQSMYNYISNVLVCAKIVITDGYTDPKQHMEICATVFKHERELISKYNVFRFLKYCSMIDEQGYHMPPTTLWLTWPELQTTIKYCNPKGIGDIYQYDARNAHIQKWKTVIGRSLFPAPRNHHQSYFTYIPRRLGDVSKYRTSPLRA